MIWTSRFLFLDSHATACLSLVDFIVDRSIDPVHLTSLKPPRSSSGVVHAKGAPHEHLLDAEDFFNRRNKSILDFEKIFVCMRNPYGLELARYLEFLEGPTLDACPAQKIAINGSFLDFLEFAPENEFLPPRLDRYFEALGRMPENLAILRYESLEQDLRMNLTPYLTDGNIVLDLPDDRLAIEGIYDVAAEALCHSRHRWFFDKGYYPRMAAAERRESHRVGPASVFYFMNRSRNSMSGQETAVAMAAAEGAAPTVSIVIVSSSPAEFLRQALASVYRQTFTDWELLLVNDGSTDACGRMAEELAVADSRVRLLQHTGGGHQGIGDSRNLAYRHARGEFVAKLDSDDVYAVNTAIAEQVAIMRANPRVAMVQGPSSRWVSWISGEDTIQVPSHADEEVEATLLAPKFIRNWNDEPHSRLERRSAVEAVGGCAPDFPGQGADFSLWLKLALRFPIYVSSRCWYRLRMHPQCDVQGVLGQFHDLQETSQLYGWADRYLKDDRTLSGSARVALRLELRRMRILQSLSWRHELVPWIRRVGNRWRYKARETGRWLSWWAKVAVIRTWNLLRRAPTGTLAVTPMVIWLEPRPPTLIDAGSVEICWAARGTERIDIRLDAPNGTFVVRSAAAQGSKTTGPWVEDRARLFLQNASASNPGAITSTLDVIQVRVLKKSSRRL